MPKVTFVKSARKDNPEAGIKKGESYYHWGVMIGGRGVKRYSKTEPTRQQLTQSEYLQRCYDIEDRLSEDSLTPDDLESIIDDIRTLGEEMSERRDALPDSLQEGPTGELLQARADACEEWADELEGVELEEVDESDVEINDDEIDAGRDEDGEIFDEEAFNTAKENALSNKREELEKEKFDEWRENIRNVSSAADAS